MKRLYKLGKTIEFKGIKLDTIAVQDDAVEEYKAKGWGCAWDILEQSKAPKKKKEVSVEEIDTNESGKLSVNEVRTAARESGIEGWETKRIKTLKKELGLSDGDE